MANPALGRGAALVGALQRHETHRTLDLLQSARAQGVEIHVPHGLYRGSRVRLVEKPVEAEERTAGGYLLPVEQYGASSSSMIALLLVTSG